MAWVYYIIGSIFCLTGLYLLFKNLFEEGKSIFYPVVIIVLGVFLIAIGTAISLKMMD